MATISLGGYLLLLPFYPIGVVILSTMGMSILLTGALHEDGFADACDGFGGGFTKAQILTIMKDSRLGTYGVIGLLGLLSLKFSLLCKVKEADFVLFFLVGTVGSRALAPWITYRTPYANFSKQQMAFTLDCSFKNLMTNTLIGFVPLGFLACTHLLKVSLLVAVLALVVFFIRRYVMKKIGGYTGDLIGATQQFIEVLIYLFLIIRLF